MCLSVVKRAAASGFDMKQVFRCSAVQRPSQKLNPSVDNDANRPESASTLRQHGEPASPAAGSALRSHLCWLNVLPEPGAESEPGRAANKHRGNDRAADPLKPPQTEENHPNYHQQHPHVPTACWEM